MMRELLAITKALGDANRLRVVGALQGRELCLCQIVEMLGLATSTVSRHMSILQHARLVDSRKHGRWTYFRLAEGDAPPAARDAAALVGRALVGDARAQEDCQRVEEILKLDPEEVCRKQSECKC
jgi:ArsR family transcriptional regulator